MRRPPALLGALDHDDGDRVRLHLPSTLGEPVEFEYELWSYGTLVPAHFVGSTNSEAARVLLADGPFRLVATTCAADALPQRLALTFRVSTQVVRHGTASTFMSAFDAEVARDFAALLSLITRRRVFAIELRRYAGMPTTTSVASYFRRPTQEPQAPTALDPAAMRRAYRGLRALDLDRSTACLSALRLYNAAVETLFSDPGLAYLHLVMALEAIAGVVIDKSALDADDIDRVITQRYSGWRALAETLPADDRPRLHEMLRHAEYFLAKRTTRFVESYVPERFFDATADDAKPRYLQTVASLDKVETGWTDSSLQPFERISREELRKALRAVYNARSAFVHSGQPFPSSIVCGHFHAIPAEAVSELAAHAFGDAGKEAPPRLPPLLTFERLVAECLKEYVLRAGDAASSDPMPA